MKKYLYTLILLMGLSGFAYANSKVTALTENTTPISTDIMYLVDDPGGTPASQKVTATNLITKAHGLGNGMVEVAAGAMGIATAGTDYATGDSTNTFTNKTIDADGTGNSITNIENADIKAAAAIAATKIADGTVTNAEFQYINSLSSNAQTQITTNSTAADESADTTCFPVFITAATGLLPPKTGTNLTFDSDTGMLTATGFTGPLTGNASTATTLEAARTIGNVSFNGSANISPDRGFEGDTVTALTPGDATPEIATKNLYDCTGGTAITITNFVDSDGDHSEFSDGDYFGVLMNDVDVEIDFSNNANIEGNADTDFTGSASQIVLLTFVFQGSTWYCDNYNMGFSDPLTFASKIKKGQYTDADGFTMTAAQSYHYTHYATGAGTITLQPVSSGMAFCIENHTAGDVYVDPDAAEVIRLNGVALTGGWRALGTDIGDMICCEYYSAGVWSCMASGYADAGS